MALGIGANTAIFTLVDQVLLRQLPVKDPQQLVQLTMDGMHFGSNWGDGSELSFPMYTDFRDHNQVFSGAFGRFGYTSTLPVSAAPNACEERSSRAPTSPCSASGRQSVA